MILIIIGFALFFILASSFFIVYEKTAHIVERLGKFHTIAMPGINFKLPFIDNIVEVVNLKIQQLDVDVETKTLDNVFVKIICSVQFQVLKDKIEDSFYKLDSPTNQMQSYIFDVIRAKIPSINLDDVFARKDDIAIAVQTELKDVMDEFGFYIIRALVTDIRPNEKVKAAMNEINSAQREKAAMLERAEGKKWQVIKEAEAEAEAKKLQGVGIANQRKEIANGFRLSFNDLKENNSLSEEETLKFLMMLQYLDTLKEMSKSHGTIFMSSSPDGLDKLFQEMQKVMISANAVKKDGKN